MKRIASFFLPNVSMFGSCISLTTKVSGDFFPRVHYSIKLKYISILSKTEYKEAFVQTCCARTHACSSFFLPFFSRKPETIYATVAHAPLLRPEHLLPGIAAAARRPVNKRARTVRESVTLLAATWQWSDSFPPHSVVFASPRQTLAVRRRRIRSCRRQKVYER